MNRFTLVVAGLLLAGAYPLSAEDISVKDVVKPNLRAIGGTQGAGTPNAIGAGAFIPLHATNDAVTYVDVEAKAHLDDRSGDSSIINTDVAGTTLSTSTRLGYRWINDVGSWMVGVYAGYDTRELKAGPVDTGVIVTNPQTVHFQQVAVGAEAVSNQWSVHAYVLAPINTTEKQLNSYYNAGALETAGVDVGYQINDKTKATVGYYHQTGDMGEAVGSGASAGLSYDINDNLTADVKVTYDDAFETRVMATLKYTFSNLIKGDEAEKEATTNAVMKALSASPEQRDIRVHDAVSCTSIFYHRDEGVAPFRGNDCFSDCDCDGARTCHFTGSYTIPYGYCQGTARSDAACAAASNNFKEFQTCINPPLVKNGCWDHSAGHYSPPGTLWHTHCPYPPAKPKPPSNNCVKGRPWLCHDKALIGLGFF